MKYVLNIGHATVNGPALSVPFIEKEIGYYFRVDSHRVVESEYQGVPETTSVIRFQSAAPLEDVLSRVGNSATLLDQECIAVAAIAGNETAGYLVGPNPAKLEFDFDYFRM